MKSFAPLDHKLFVTESKAMISLTIAALLAPISAKTEVGTKLLGVGTGWGLYTSIETLYDANNERKQMSEDARPYREALEGAFLVLRIITEQIETVSKSLANAKAGVEQNRKFCEEHCRCIVCDCDPPPAPNL